MISKPDVNHRALETRGFLDCRGLGRPSVGHPCDLCIHVNLKYIFKHNHVCLLCHCGLEPLKCFISLINKKFFCFLIYFGQYFHLPVFSPSLKLHAIPNSFSGIICGPLWGSFVVLGSFAVQFGDHLRSGIICGLGIICGAVQISSKDKQIAQTLKLDDRIEVSACRDSFITLKDHKPDFKNNPTCRLLNPSKSEIGIVSKNILDNINTKVIQATKVNLWRSTSNAIEWFKTIPNKQKHAFITFDVCDFYPSISEELLIQGLEGYFRDPGFDQNTVRDSGKRKIF